MGTLIANAATTQNLTGAATFAAAEVGALALNLVRNTTASLATAATVTSATFTVTAAKVIDGVLLYLQTSGTVGTGTFKVDLQKSAVSQASVTVNKADLPDSTNSIPVPVFFKFTGTATGDGAATWTLVLTTTSGTGSATITYNINAAGATNLTRALRTTTAATPAAADDLYIVGDLTGAGTKTTRTVTMNSTAATAYGNGALNSTTVNGGGVHVANWGTLAFGTTVAINYIMRLAGDLIVYQFGTLNLGSSGAEIPRNSSAILEFQPISASGDFGLRCLHNSVVVGAGLSRTVGKNVVQAKLTADVVSSSVVNQHGNSATTETYTSLGADGVSLLATAISDTVANSTHSVYVDNLNNVTNTTQVCTVWLARGSGTNNRFMRAICGNNPVVSSITNGFFSDIDLQAGTAGTVTVVGTGTATSVTITPVGAGYLIRLTGKVASGASAQYFHVAICSAAGTTSFAGAANQAVILDHMAIVTAASISDTTLNVNADTGWLSGDLIVVASTTRTAGECEILPLNANAGVSSMTSALYPFGTSIGNFNYYSSTHSGTGITAGEVGLLTRNVKIRSTSTTLGTYVYCMALASVNFSWVEFYNIGSATTNKRGIEIDTSATVATAKSFTFCSMHESIGAAITTIASANNSLNLTFSNNVLWYSTGTSLFQNNAAVTLGDWTLDNNLAMRSGAIGFNMNSVTGTFTNNTAAGNTTAGFAISDTLAPSVNMGTWSGNTTHSNGTQGVSIAAVSTPIGTFTSFSSWRNSSYGILLSIGFSDSLAEVVFNNLTLFGNSIANLIISSGPELLTITGTSVIAGDTTFATPVGIQTATGSSMLWYTDISSVDFSGTGTGLAPHTTADLAFAGVSFAQNIRGVVNNCKFGAPTVMTKALWGPSSYVSFEKYNQVAGDHRTEMAYGQIRTDPTIYRVTAPSMRLTPASATAKLQSAPKYRGRLGAMVSGTARHVSVYVRKSQAADGAAYNGNQPRLIQRANPSLGVNVDTVLDTMVVAVGTWEKLEADTSVPNDGGAFEFIVDGDGTAGWLNINDWAIT